MKRLVCAVLTLVLLMTTTPFTLASGDTIVKYPVEGGNIYFDTATGEVTDSDSDVTVANIPSEINGVKVTAIGSYAFSNCDSLTSVSIPDGVTAIDGDAFYWCASLNSISIPDSVTWIWSYAFYGCASLTSIFIPNGVAEIYGNPFGYCDSLTEITVANGNKSFKSINGVLFSFDGESIISYPAGKQGNKYSIPDGVTVIGDSAFCGCASLTSVTIPNSVTWIEANPFPDCLSLSEITVASGNKTFKSIDGVLFSFDGKRIITYPEGKQDNNYSIPDGVTVIEDSAFNRCPFLTSVSIPDSVTLISNNAFSGCFSLAINIPNSVVEIGACAFSGNYFTSVSIPDSVMKIGDLAFSHCQYLTSIFISDSVTTIGRGAFSGCKSLADIFFSGSEEQWNSAIGENNIFYDNINDDNPYYIATPNVNIHYNSPAPDYVYNVPDPGADVAELPEYTTDDVTDTASATNAVSALTGAMSGEQKTSATGVDLATLLAETAAARAASQAVKGKEIIISKATVSPLVEKSASAVQAVEDALVSGGVVTGRYLSSTVILTTTETGELTVKIDPDVLETEVDRVRIETPNYALTLKMSDLQADLTKVITIKVSGSGTAAGTQAVTASVRGAFFMRPQETALLAPAGTTAGASVTLTLPGGKLTNPVTVSFPSDGDDSDETVVDTDGDVSSSKFNPATSTLDGKVTESGTYTTKYNSKDFTDIQDKSAEMQTAIRYLASKGIINGTGGTKFEPDGSIKRSEIAALIVRALGKQDSTARSTFTDVKPTDWYDSAVASCVKIKVLNGYTDNTFRGEKTILKQEILKVAYNVLVQEMGYKEPKDAATYLSRYSEKDIATWIQEFLPLVTRENLVVYRVDGTFSGDLEMTRGDAAIILYRLFQRIW